MKITFTDNMNVVHALPKLTPALKQEFEDAQAAGGETLRAKYDLMVRLMGDSAQKAFDSDSFDSCDTTAVELCFGRAVRAYQSVLVADQMNQVSRTLNQVPLDKLDKIVGINKGL